MTALTRYARLESTGYWRPSKDDAPFEVVVSFGDASLIIRDTSGQPLTHWSLPATMRLNGTEMPALYSPDSDAFEVLEIEDETMVEAIETVRDSIARRRPTNAPRRKGWIRGILLLAIVAGAFTLPPLLRHQAVEAVPMAKREEIGATILGHLQRVSGTACRNPRGLLSLNRLKSRALPNNSDAQVVILPEEVPAVLALPGNITVLNRSLVENHEDPAVAAGYLIAAERIRAENDPLAEVLSHIGLFETFHLLTTGEIDSNALREYALSMSNEDLPQPSLNQMLAAFENAQISTKPYAYAVDETGNTTANLIAADPVNAAQAPLILSDGDWVALQNICGR
ncbi:hypothetical protein [Marivivens aquimaris]|uniref:hypothetical protein n=1 Tax=Marivivens aquimaris TaxID=2774876 RepID=UPI001882FA69|nr:hypothetical protein [Marivivens aquimaris]